MGRRFLRGAAVGAMSVLFLASLGAPAAEAYCGSLCTPNGLMVLEASEAGSSAVVATSATTQGISGIQLGSALSGSAGAGAAAITLAGWPTGQVAISNGAAGLAKGVDPLAGWEADPSEAIVPVGELWTGGGVGNYFRARITIDYNTTTGGTITAGRYFGTGLQGINTTIKIVFSQPAEPIPVPHKHSGSLTGWKTFGAPGSATATQTITVMPGATGFDANGHRWYAPGQANRPADVSVTAGAVTRYVTCVGAAGVAQTVSGQIAVDMGQEGAFLAPAVTCPPGTVPSRFWSTWRPQGGEEQLLTPETTTPEWVRSIASQYPDCLSQQCFLRLFKVSDGTEISCGELAANCEDWYIEPDRTAAYKCYWGSYAVALHYCSVFRDPGRILSNAHVDENGNAAYDEWPELLITSATAQRLIGRLTDRYQLESCAALGEAVRAEMRVVAVPDLTGVCAASGVTAALHFARGSDVSTGPLDVMPALFDAADGPLLSEFHPECDELALDGSCIDGEVLVAPEPQPDPAGGAIKPPSNCLDPLARQLLEDSMPVEGHHMATKYGELGEEFRQIFDSYSLSIDGLWNVWEIRHRGPHPWNYHDWVMQNTRRADAAAQLAPASQQAAVFQSLFKQYVVDPVLQDSTIVRAAYWKCKEDYRWR